VSMTVRKAHAALKINRIRGVRLSSMRWPDMPKAVVQSVDVILDLVYHQV
jgi:hypothetical protein